MSLSSSKRYDDADYCAELLARLLHVRLMFKFNSVTSIKDIKRPGLTCSLDQDSREKGGQDFPVDLELLLDKRSMAWSKHGGGEHPRFGELLAGKGHTANWTQVSSEQI